MLSGIITGEMAFNQKKSFLGDSLMLCEIQNFDFSLYSVDFLIDANTIQQQVKNQFSQIYSGDVNVTVFKTENTYGFPSDSLKASKFQVGVEIRLPVANLGGMFPELSGSYYAGLDSGFFTSFGATVTDFKEDFGFATNQNGNRDFSHSLSFGIRTGISGTNTQSGRKTLAGQIASGIFAQDKNTTFGIYAMSGQVSGVGDSGLYRSYFSETYDLLKNTYSFSRKREQLPFDASGAVINLSNSINMGTDGVIQVSEKASTQGKINFPSANSVLESFLTGSYSRCSGVYSKFYNTGIIVQDSQYSPIYASGLLPLINTPIKTVKTYDVNSLSANYDVTYTNNPNFSGDGTMTSQTFDIKINEYNVVEISHNFDYEVNKIINNSGYFATLMNNTTGTSPSAVMTYYKTNFSNVFATFPAMNMINNTFTWPNIKTKGSAKFEYSNSPKYFVTVNGLLFNMLDYSVKNERPSDIVNEYKIVNRPTKSSLMSYAYQSEKGTITIDMKTLIGKQSTQFSPDGVGNFTTINGTTLGQYVQALYLFGGQVFMKQFGFPTVAWNWFLSDSNYSFDSHGALNLSLGYTYTLKRRLAQNFL